jgi:hypothetical protein
MKEEKLYQCEVCGLHYENEQHAEDCYDYCSINNACSLEITKLSAEYKKAKVAQQDKNLIDKNSL